MPTVKLTKSFADRLKPGPRDAIHWDTDCRGLHLKVTPAGKKVFLVYYRPKGASSQQRRYKLGDYGVLTVQQKRASSPHQPDRGPEPGAQMHPFAQGAEKLLRRCHPEIQPGLRRD